MAAKPCEYNATVTYIRKMTPSLAIFRVVPDEPMEGFIPGQYTVLGLNHPEKGAVLRAYSIASPPHLHGDYFEFYIRYVNQPTSDNPLTHLLFDLKEGDRIHMRNKCRGKFTIDHTVGTEDSRLKVLVAAGTGLAPFTSMVLQHQHKHGTPGDYAILHGASYPVDLGYKAELEGLMNGNGKVRYCASISRPQEVEGWRGLTGRVEAHFTPDRLTYVEQEMGLEEGWINPDNAVVLICGLQGTIANTAASLLFRGFVPEDRKLRKALGVPDETKATLFWEQYDTTPIIDTKDEALVAELADRLRGAGVALQAPGAS